MSPFMRGYTGIAPGLDGFLLSRRHQQEDQLNQLRSIQTMIGLRGLLMKQQMAPLEMEQMRARVSDMQSQAAYRQAQADRWKAEGDQTRLQNTSRLGLAGLLGGEPAMYGGNVDRVFIPGERPANVPPEIASMPGFTSRPPEEQAAIAAVANANAGKAEFTAGVPSRGNYMGLMSLAYPNAVPEMLKRLTPEAPKPYTLSPGAERRGPNDEVVATNPRPHEVETWGEPYKEGNVTFQRSSRGRVRRIGSDPNERPLGPGVHRLSDGSTISVPQMFHQWKADNKLMDEIDLKILDRTDPARAAQERRKAAMAKPFPDWALDQFNIDITGRGRTAPSAPTPGAAQPGAGPNPANAQQRKSIGGKSYVKINGQWYEE